MQIFILMAILIMTFLTTENMVSPQHHKIWLYIGKNIHGNSFWQASGGGSYSLQSKTQVRANILEYHIAT